MSTTTTLRSTAMGTWVFLFATAASALATGEEPKPGDPHKKAADDAQVALFTGDAKGRRGLQAYCSEEIHAQGKNAGDVAITIVNLLDEEVFVHVDGFDGLGYDLRKGIDDEEEEWAFGGGGFIIFPDNVRRLKRLHATDYSDGRATTCGCAVAHISGKIALDELAEWVGAKGKITIVVSGYRRSNGKYFSGEVDLPVTIVK